MRNRENIVIFNIKDVEPEYTGGGIWCFTGQLSDGTYFLFDSDNFDLRLVNERPEPETCWYAEWQEEHLVCDLASDTYGAWFMLAILSRLDYPSELEGLHHRARQNISEKGKAA